MGIIVNMRLGISKAQLASPRIMRQIGMDSILLIRERTVAGQSYTGQAFKPYSTKPISIPKTAFPKPKGGRPSNSGRSVFYAGGYREYKQLSRMPGTVRPRKNKAAKKPTAEVDLTLTGLLMNSMHVTQVTKTSVTVGVTGPALDYAYYVNQARPFMGLSTTDINILADVYSDLIARELR